MTTYADPSRCPDCRALLFRAPQACPNCRLPLTGQTAGDLFRTLQEADRLITVLREDRVPIGVGAAPVARRSESMVEGLAPYPSASPPAAAPAAPRVRGTSVPQIL